MAATNTKNRFSELLEHLLTLSNTKNITLAKELQYDESYISKWCSGKLLPPEKNFEKILRGISNCIVKSLNKDTLSAFSQQYQLEDASLLGQAIYDNLYEEYIYVKTLKQETGKEIAPTSSYLPELTLTQFISKLHHPSLRYVNDLDVVAIMDILALDNDYRLSLATFQNSPVLDNYYPGVQFSCVICLSNDSKTHFTDALFLMNMLTNLSNINLRLYCNNVARGKLLFAIKDSFSITGLLLDSNHCLAVNINEEKKTCNLLYNRMHSLCTKNTLLFRNTTIEDMITHHEYTQSLLSSNLRCIIGQLSEHFMPDDLHMELLRQYCTNPEQLEAANQLHQIVKQVIKKQAIHVVIFDNALFNFAISGQLDFYNHKIQLTPAQRLQYLNHLLNIFTQQDNLTAKLIVGNLASNFLNISKTSLFLSNSICYLRITKSRAHNIFILNNEEIKTVFSNFFGTIWNDTHEAALKDELFFIQYIQESINATKILAET